MRENPGSRGRIQPADTAGSSSVNVQCIASARRTPTRGADTTNPRQVQKMIKRRLILALFIILAIAGIGGSGFADMLVNGAAATVPHPIYSNWLAFSAKEDT